MTDVVTGQQRCRNCGYGNPEANRFCEECGQSLGITARATRFTSPEQRSDAPSTPPSAVAGPPDSARGRLSLIEGTTIALSEGERLWRSYPMEHFRPFRTRAHGTLYVTDSRLLLYSTARKLSGRTWSLQEVRIEAVKGISGNLDRGLGPIGSLLFVLAAIFCLVSLVRGPRGIGLLLFIFLALVYLISYYYGRIGLVVHTQQVTPGAIAFGHRRTLRVGVLGPVSTLFFAVFGVTSADILYCFPERDAEAVILELGALVYDLNRVGTLEGTQWDPSTL
jgi:hypothetical protein